MGSGLSVFSSGRKGYDPNVLSMKHFDIHRVVGKGGFGKVNAVIRKKTSPPQWFAVKTLSKVVVVKKNCVQMIWNERNLLVVIKSPYIVMMHHAFQDQYNCYMIMDLLLGGDLKFHLTGTYKSGFSEAHARFYVAGTLCSLQYLHTKGILHRDIKPENVILDDKGYPRLTDMGVSVQVDNLRYRGNSGTTPYMAPELFFGSHEHGIAADFFSLGIFAHELLFGKKPWTGSVEARLENCMGIMTNFPEDKYIDYYTPEMLDVSKSSKLSMSCRSLLRELLHPEEAKRLGYNGATEIMQHEWFSGFDWDAYANRTMAVPFRPVVDESKANCNTAAVDFEDVLDQSSEPSERIKADEQEQFADFEFNTAIETVAATTPS